MKNTPDSSPHAVQAPHLPSTGYYASEHGRCGYVGNLFDRTTFDNDRIDRLLALGKRPLVPQPGAAAGRAETRDAHRRRRRRHLSDGARSGQVGGRSRFGRVRQTQRRHDSLLAPAGGPNSSRCGRKRFRFPMPSTISSAWAMRYAAPATYRPPSVNFIASSSPAAASACLKSPDRNVLGDRPCSRATCAAWCLCWTAWLAAAPNRPSCGLLLGHHRSLRAAERRDRHGGVSRPHGGHRHIETRALSILAEHKAAKPG